MKVMLIPIVVNELRKVPKNLVKGLEELAISGGIKTIQIQHCWDRLEYWEESWRLEVTRWHSSYSIRPPAKQAWKPQKEWNNSNHKAFHPRDNIDRLYVSRKEGGRGLANIEDNVDASRQRLKDYIKKAQRKTDHDHQKRYWQHEDQQNRNNQKTKVGGRKTLWTF